MSITSGDVLKFILDSFPGDELEGFCFVYFQEVQNLLSTGMSRETQARRLVEYCQSRGRVADLFRALQTERPLPFERCFPPPLPEKLDDEFPELEPGALSMREIQLSEMIADRLIAERVESIRIFQLYLAGLILFGMLVMAVSLILLLDPFRQVTAAGGVFICSLGALQVPGIIGRREQKGRCETIKSILAMAKNGQGGIDANTWKQIQDYLWGEMNKAGTGGRVLMI